MDKNTQQTVQNEKKGLRRLVDKLHLEKKELVLLWIFLGIFLLMSIISPGRFLSIYNLQSMAYQFPEFGILALAMMVIIVTGGINLSITYSATLSSIIGAVVLVAMNSAGVPELITVIVGVVVIVVTSIIAGAVNGLIVAHIGIVPMLATLGTMTLFEGISLNITKGGAISGFPTMFQWFGNSSILGIPVPLFIFVLVIIATYFILQRSSFGAKVYMIGCNPTATRFSGVNVKRTLFILYIYSGILTGLAGLIMASRYNSAKESYGYTYLLQSVSAAVLGGTDISGGFGKVFGTVVSVLILQVISSGLNIFGVNRFITDVIMGMILILVLTINFINNRMEEKALVTKKVVTA
jgi:ribose/xylose/arabinose/galactoside ABC-type transport system permease subunit